MGTAGLIKELLFGLILAANIWLVLPVSQSLAQSPPTFGGEIYSFVNSSTNTPPGICRTSSNVSLGQRVVVIAVNDGPHYIGGVTDTRGNTYSQMLWYDNRNFSPGNISIWSAFVTTPLTASSDTITITWDSAIADWTAYAVSIAAVNNTAQCGQPDSTGQNNAYMYSGVISIPGRTVSQNTVIVGAVMANEFVWKPHREWTIYDSKTSNIHYDFFYGTVSSSGHQSPGGTGPPHNTFAGAWVAFR